MHLGVRVTVSDIYIFGCLERRAANGTVIGEWRTKKYLQRSDGRRIEVLSRHFPGGTEKNYKNLYSE
jgi:hypothetical protein